MLNEGRGLGQGGFGTVAAQGQSSLAWHSSPDTGHDPWSAGRHFLIVRTELLGGVKSWRFIHYTVGQCGEVIALFCLDDVRMGVADLGAWGGESWYPEREAWISASLSVHPGVAGALDLSGEGSNLYALFQDLPILLFVLTGSVCCLNCILQKKMQKH